MWTAALSLKDGRGRGRLGRWTRAWAAIDWRRLGQLKSNEFGGGRGCVMSDTVEIREPRFVSVVGKTVAVEKLTNKSC